MAHAVRRCSGEDRNAAFEHSKPPDAAKPVRDRDGEWPRGPEGAAALTPAPAHNGLTIADCQARALVHRPGVPAPSVESAAMIRYREGSGGGGTRRPNFRGVQCVGIIPTKRPATAAEQNRRGQTHVAAISQRSAIRGAQGAFEFPPKRRHVISISGRAARVFKGPPPFPERIQFPRKAAARTRARSSVDGERCARKTDRRGKRSRDHSRSAARTTKNERLCDAFPICGRI